MPTSEARETRSFKILDQLSRERALTDAESLSLERMIRSQQKRARDTMEDRRYG